MPGPNEIPSDLLPFGDWISDALNNDPASNPAFTPSSGPGGWEIDGSQIPQPIVQPVMDSMQSQTSADLQNLADLLAGSALDSPFFAGLAQFQAIEQLKADHAVALAAMEATLDATRLLMSNPFQQQ